MRIASHRLQIATRGKGLYEITGQIARSSQTLETVCGGENPSLHKSPLFGIVELQTDICAFCHLP